MTKQISYFLAYLCTTLFFIRINYVLFEWWDSPSIRLTKIKFTTFTGSNIPNYVLNRCSYYCNCPPVPNIFTWQHPKPSFTAGEEFWRGKDNGFSRSRQKLSLKSGRILWYSFCALCITLSHDPVKSVTKSHLLDFFPQQQLCDSWNLSLFVEIDRKCVLSAIIFYEINKTNYYEVTTQLFWGCFKAVLKIVLNVVLKVSLKLPLKFSLILYLMSFWCCPQFLFNFVLEFNLKGVLTDFFDVVLW